MTYTDNFKFKDKLTMCCIHHDKLSDQPSAKAYQGGQKALV